jgi:hypothetical protein
MSTSIQENDSLCFSAPLFIHRQKVDYCANKKSKASTLLFLFLKNRKKRREKKRREKIYDRIEKIETVLIVFFLKLDFEFFMNFEIIQWKGKYVLAMVKFIFFIADFNPESNPEEVHYMWAQNYIIVTEVTPHEFLLSDCEIKAKYPGTKMKHIEKLGSHLDSMLSEESFLKRFKRKMIRPFQQMLPPNVGIDKVYCAGLLPTTENVEEQSIVLSQGSWECNFGSDQCEILDGPFYGESDLPFYIRNGVLNVEVSSSSQKSAFTTSVPYPAVPEEFANTSLQEKIPIFIPEDWKDNFQCKFFAKNFNYNYYFQLEKTLKVVCREFEFIPVPSDLSFSELGAPEKQKAVATSLDLMPFEDPISGLDLSSFRGVNESLDIRPVVFPKYRDPFWTTRPPTPESE